MDYSWMNGALAWLAPVASQSNSFFVYPDKLLAFSGDTAEYDTPFSMTNEVFGVQFAPARAIDWSRVTGVTREKTLNVSISGGVVKLPIVDHVYDPAAIVVEGETHSAGDIVSAIKAVINGVARDVPGWYSCVHFDANAVVSVQSDGSFVQRVNLPFEISKPAELHFESARAAISLPLSQDASVIFAGEIEIEDRNGNRTGKTSYGTMTIDDGNARWMTVLCNSVPNSIEQATAKLYDLVTHHMEIGPELADVFKMIKALGSGRVYADLFFRDDGLFVSGPGVEMVQVPVSYINDQSPNSVVRLQIALVELEKGAMSCGYSGQKPFAIYRANKDVFIAQMSR